MLLTVGIITGREQQRAWKDVDDVLFLMWVLVTRCGFLLKIDP